jgi:YegS/Rv2252/BmrU family lipid kinase
MKSREEESPRSLIKTLRRKQRQHRIVLAKVEKTTARLERRRAKLHAIETRIATLEHRLSEPRKLGKEDTNEGGELRHARLIFNPASGPDGEDNADRLKQIVSALRLHGIEAHIGLKTSGKMARHFARQAARCEHSLVIVAGGDGTIEDVASQLVGSRSVLGIVPIGTMNNLARSLGVPLDIEGACALIAMGTTRHIDVGRVFSDDKPEARYFLECAGVGLNAIGAMLGQDYEKGRWWSLPRGLRKYFESKPGTIRVELDDITIDASTHMVTVSNSPLMGNNMIVAPGAKMDDGWLDVCVYEGMGDASLAKHFMAASLGAPEDTKIYRARKVRITSEQPLLSNTDMDIAKEQPVLEIEIVPKALSVIVGNGIGLSLPVESAPATAARAPDPPHTNGTSRTPDEKIAVPSEA